MSLPPLSQSSEKSVLSARLGLTDEIYRQMLDEAIEGRNRLSKDPANLTPQSRLDARVQPLYKWDQLSETAKHQEVLNIAKLASSSTKPYFDKGRYHTQVCEENWVARWFLWHSFRYRDNRPIDRGQAAQDPGNNYGGKCLQERAALEVRIWKEGVDNIQNSKGGTESITTPYTIDDQAIVIRRHGSMNINVLHSNNKKLRLRRHRYM